MFAATVTLPLTVKLVLLVMAVILLVVAAPTNSIHSPTTKSSVNVVLVPVITFVADAATVPDRATVDALPLVGIISILDSPRSRAGLPLNPI